MKILPRYTKNNTINTKIKNKTHHKNFTQWFKHLQSIVVTTGTTGAVVTAGPVVDACKQFSHSGLIQWFLLVMYSASLTKCSNADQWFIFYLFVLALMETWLYFTKLIFAYYKHSVKVKYTNCFELKLEMPYPSICVWAKICDKIC